MYVIKNLCSNSHNGEDLLLDYNDMNPFFVTIFSLKTPKTLESKLVPDMRGTFYYEYLQTQGNIDDRLITKIHMTLHLHLSMPLSYITKGLACLLYKNEG